MPDLKTPENAGQSQPVGGDLANSVIAAVTPHESDDVAILAAELGLPDDPVALDVLRRAWRAGLFRAVVAVRAALAERL